MKSTITAILAAGVVMAPSASFAAITAVEAAVLGYAVGQVACTLDRHNASQEVINEEMERLGADARNIIGKPLTAEDVNLVMTLAQSTFNSCEPRQVVLPDA